VNSKTVFKERPSVYGRKSSGEYSGWKTFRSSSKLIMARIVLSEFGFWKSIKDKKFESMFDVLKTKKNGGSNNNVFVPGALFVSKPWRTSPNKCE
jgi:hypothetical protein